jgi:hypothetical protein
MRVEQGAQVIMDSHLAIGPASGFHRLITIATKISSGIHAVGLRIVVPVPSVFDAYIVDVVNLSGADGGRAKVGLFD